MTKLQRLQKKEQRLQHSLQNAIKSGNKAKAVKAILELDLVTEELKQLQSEQEITVGNVFCLMNADLNLIFGWYEIEKETDKAIKIANTWIPRRALVQTMIDDNHILRLRHWFEESLSASDLANLDQDKLAINQLQINKSIHQKIEVPMLKRVLDDTSFIKVFFIPVPEDQSLVRIRKCKGIDEIFTENVTWLTGKKEATILYNKLVKEKHYASLRTKFADY